MNSIIGILFGISAMLGFGFESFLLVKISRKIGAFRAVLWMEIFLVIMFAVLAIFLFNYKSIGIFTIALIILTAIIDMAGLFAYSKGLQVGNVSIVATVASAWGAVTAVLGVVFLGETLTLFQILDICLIIAGTVLVSFELKNMQKMSLKRRNLGLGYALITVFGWGAFFFLISFLVKSLGWFSAGFLVAIPTMFLFILYGTTTKSKLSIGKGSLGLIVVMSALNLIAFLSYNLGVSYNYTAIVAPISAASPVIVILLALVFLKEKLAINQKLGIFMVLIGLILLSA